MGALVKRRCERPSDFRLSQQCCGCLSDARRIVSDHMLHVARAQDRAGLVGSLREVKTRRIDDARQTSHANCPQRTEGPTSRRARATTTTAQALLRATIARPVVSRCRGVARCRRGAPRFVRPAFRQEKSFPPIRWQPARGSTQTASTQSILCEKPGAPTAGSSRTLAPENSPSVAGSA